MSLRRRLLERSWPKPHVDLLLRAILAPQEAAEAAWREWTRTRVFEDAEGVEVRLLAPLAKRLARLDPASPLRPRIEGLAKQTWTHAQITLRDAVDALDILRAAGIPHLIFKGGAHYAEGLGSATRRILSDLDILVRPEDAARAIEAVTLGGWQANRGESAAYLKRLARVRLSTNFRKGAFGEIDLHRHLFHYSARSPAFDAGLWQRARQVGLAGRPILVPDPTDGLVISLAHGALSGSGDWAIDVAARVTEQQVDWDRLVATADELRLVPAALAGLLYVRERLAVAVPDAVLSRLERLPVSLAEWMKHWSNAREGHERTRWAMRVDRLANWLLPKDRFELRVSDRAAVTVARAQPTLDLLAGRRLPLPAETADLALRHNFPVTGAAKPQRLALRLAIAEPEARRRVHFDVTAGGEGVARLRTRSGGKGSGRPRALSFSLALPPAADNPCEIVVEARPLAYQPPGSDDAAKAPLPFRILAARLR